MQWHVVPKVLSKLSLSTYRSDVIVLLVYYD